MGNPVISGIVRKQIEISVDIELTANDLFNWLTDCRDIKTLNYLGHYALKCANDLENPPEDDDFRSRA